MHRYQDLIQIFEHCFFESHNTRLIKGDDEPVYLPADETFSYHRIVFAHGYFASALHEIAHWCIAGKARRQLEDYGYWYCPDGRNAQQQADFEVVEVKPQALEYAFSLACGFRFQVSTDNLHGVEPDREAFNVKVKEQYAHYTKHGFPARGQIFITALNRFYAPVLSSRLPSSSTLQGEVYAAV